RARPGCRLLVQAPWTRGLGTTLDADFAKCEDEPVSARHQPEAPQNVLAKARSGRNTSESMAPDRRARHLEVACRIAADVSVSGRRSATHSVQHRRQRFSTDNTCRIRTAGDL